VLRGRHRPIQGWKNEEVTQDDKGAQKMARLNYPDTATGSQIDDYHGVRVADPYRWLEDTESADTKAWIDAQNKVTFGFLESIPSREEIRKRLTELWDYPKASAPKRKGKRYFQNQNTGLQNQDVLFVKDGLEGKGRVLLDPNSFSEDGTVALVSWSVSKDGNWLAYAMSASGSDWLEWKIRDVSSGEDLPDEVRWSKFCDAAWNRDGSGFYYSRYDAPLPGEDYTGTNTYQKLYYHQRATNQEQDILIYERPDQRGWGFEALVSDDGKFLVLRVGEGTDTRNRVFYQNLETNGPFVELIPDLEAAYHFVGNDGTLFYFRTDLDATRARLISIETTNPKREHWLTLIPETNDVLEMVRMVNEEFIALYLHNAYHQIKRFALDGAYLGEIELPSLGSVSNTGSLLNLSGERQDAELFYGFWSFLQPPSIFRYDFKSHTSAVIFSPKLNFDAEQYETHQVFAPSKDGTLIPMFLTHKRGLVLNGKNRVLLYGYGGFNIALTPDFSASAITWLERGGVYAVANLRGGGEYGEEWHQAGMLNNKQNVFDDFIACAEWLIDQNITSTPRLAIMGGSNGGLLVGACMTQRPDLFGACIAQVGVMDMLRFQEFTIGWAWVSDFGSSADPDQFKTLYAYSPLHNLKPGTHYPAALITTGDHDDRVVPGHSFKFAAALQAAQSGDAPVLIRIQTKAGHGLGKPTALMIRETSDIFAFLDRVLLSS
jgi:prolyl oligopeptidase